MPTEDVSIFGMCLGRRLVKCSSRFQKNFEDTERMAGGGDAGPRKDQKIKPILRRRSARVSPLADQEEVETRMAPKRAVRRSNNTEKSVDADNPDDVPKVKKNVKFTKRVQAQLFEIDEASPRRVEGGFRRRVQTGAKMDVKLPKEDRRLKKAGGDNSEPPQLTTAQRNDILGSATRELSAERELQLLSDSGCRSTCLLTGCGVNCLCIANGIACDDRVCPCQEETCMNAREDMEAEDRELFDMRLDLANVDLDDESLGSEQSTISSIENSTITSMYGEDESNLEDRDEDGVNVNSRGKQKPIDIDSESVADETGGSGRAGFPEIDEPQQSSNGGYSDDDMDTTEKAADAPAPPDEEMEEDALSDAPDNHTDAEEDVEPYVGPKKAADAPDAPDAPDEEMEEDALSDAPDNHTDAEEDVEPYVGPIPDIGVNLNVDQFPQEILEKLPGIIDEDARDSCDDDEWLESSAVFVGLMKEASRFNDNDSDNKCAVLHPEVFLKALELAGEDEAEKNRRKAAKIRGAAAPLALDPQIVAQSVVYGNEWSHMLIPLHLSGNHWAVAVVTRSSVSAVIFDSLKKLAEREKEETERIKSAIKKILEAAQELNNHDKITGRFKVRFTNINLREVQTDDDSCGLFAILHARRVLERGNSSAGIRKNKNDKKMNVPAERLALRNTIVELMEFFEELADQRQVLTHGPAGCLNFSPKKTRSYPSRR